MTMMFGGLTSAYIVRQAQGNFLEFPIPVPFFYSTLVILLSSLSLHLCYRAFLKEQAALYKLLLVATFVLGLVFIALQYQGWTALSNMGVMLVGNPGGAFMYVIPGIHAAHVVGGIAVLIMAMIHAFSLPVRATERRIVRLKLTLQYWHFVDFLWLYLIVFFVIQRG
jgi:cytochrome c oxidase subunit 3